MRPSKPGLSALLASAARCWRQKDDRQGRLRNLGTSISAEDGRARRTEKRESSRGSWPARNLHPGRLRRPLLDDHNRPLPGHRRAPQKSHRSGSPATIPTRIPRTKRHSPAHGGTPA